MDWYISGHNIIISMYIICMDALFEPYLGRY